MRRSELRRQKWQLKRRELELIAAKNHLMPRLDALGRYRWLGAGDRLIGDSNGHPTVYGRFDGLGIVNARQLSRVGNWVCSSRCRLASAMQ